MRMRLRDLHVSFGKADVLKGVDLDCAAGTVVSLIGPNGAGKSTCVNAIAGLNPSNAGTLTLDGEHVEMSGSPAAMVARGVRLVPQGRSLFMSMSVGDNVRMGAYHGGRNYDTQGRIEELAPYFPVVIDRFDAKASELSGGQQQMVSIMRGLMLPTRVLLLDEPSLGLAPKIVAEMADIFRALVAQEQLALVLVEQNLGLATSVSDEVAIMAEGKTRMTVAPEQLRGEAGERLLKRVFFGEETMARDEATRERR